MEEHWRRHCCETEASRRTDGFDSRLNHKHICFHNFIIKRVVQPQASTSNVKTPIVSWSMFRLPEAVTCFYLQSFGVQHSAFVQKHLPAQASSSMSERKQSPARPSSSGMILQHTNSLLDSHRSRVMSAPLPSPHVGDVSEMISARVGQIRIWLKG